MSTRPLLVGTSEESAFRVAHASTDRLQVFRSLGNIFPGATHKDSIPYEAICLMVNTEDKDKRDELTRDWRDHKIQELSFIGTVGALIAGCLASTGSWPNVLPGNMDKPWTVRASWQSGLVFALFTTMIACQQSMRLHRFSAHPEGLKYIRASLVGRRGPHSKEPSRLQVYAWETSILLLTCSIICAITGLALLVWFAAIYDDNDDFNSLKEDNYKIAITFSTTLALSLVVFILSQTAMTSLTRR